MTESQERKVYTWLGYGPDENDIFPDRPLLDYNTFMGEGVPKLWTEGYEANFYGGSKPEWAIGFDNRFYFNSNPWLALAEYLGSVK